MPSDPITPKPMLMCAWGGRYYEPSDTSEYFQRFPWFNAYPQPNPVDPDFHYADRAPNGDIFRDPDCFTEAELARGKSWYYGTTGGDDQAQAYFTQYGFDWFPNTGYWTPMTSQTSIDGHRQFWQNYLDTAYWRGKPIVGNPSYYPWGFPGFLIQQNPYNEGMYDTADYFINGNHWYKNLHNYTFNWKSKSPYALDVNCQDPRLISSRHVYDPTVTVDGGYHDFSEYYDYRWQPRRDSKIQPPVGVNELDFTIVGDGEVLKQYIQLNAVVPDRAWEEGSQLVLCWDSRSAPPGNAGTPGVPSDPGTFADVLPHLQTIAVFNLDPVTFPMNRWRTFNIEVPDGMFDEVDRQGICAFVTPAVLGMPGGYIPPWHPGFKQKAINPEPMWWRFTPMDRNGGVRLEMQIYTFAKWQPPTFVWGDPPPSAQISGTPKDVKRRFYKAITSKPKGR